MREPFTQLYLHLVWATWDRLPLISSERRDPIYACIQNECSELRCDVLGLGGIEDHAHLLVRFPTTVSVAQLAKQVKGASSHLIAQTDSSGKAGTDRLPFPSEKYRASSSTSRDRGSTIRAVISIRIWKR